MRKLIYASIIMAIGIALGACAQTTPTSTAKANLPTPMPTATIILQLTEPPSSSVTAPIAIDPIREYLAEQLSLPVAQVTLLSWQAVTWRDACLGVYEPKEMCLDVITPGFIFKFQTGSSISTVNTDAAGKNYRLAGKAESPAPLPALSWTRTGGIAGVCRNLSIYSTGAAWLTDCKTGQVLSQDVVPEADLKYLNSLIEQDGSFEWKSTPPAGSADMFNDQIRFYGAGSQAMTEAEQQDLNEYLATVASGLGKAEK